MTPHWSPAVAVLVLLGLFTLCRSERQADAFWNWVDTELPTPGRALRESNVRLGALLAERRLNELASMPVLDAVEEADRLDASTRGMLSFWEGLGLFEETFDGIASVDVKHCIGLNHSACPPDVSITLSDGRTFPLKAVEPSRLQCLKDIPVHGFIVANVFVMRPGHVRCLSKRDAEKQERVPTEEGGEVVLSIPCFVGPTVSWFESPEHAKTFALHKHARQLRPNQAQFAVGRKKVVVALMKNAVLQWANATDAAIKAQQQIETIAQWVFDSSYGALSFDITILPGVHDVTAALPGYKCSESATAQWLIISNNTGIDAASYDFRLLYCPYTKTQSWGGLGQLPGGNTWYNGAPGAYIVAHELGHNFGLKHANYGAKEYGDSFDTMGTSPFMTGQFKSLYKFSNYWFPSSKMASVALYGSTGACQDCVAPGEVELAAFDRGMPTSQSAMLAARVDLGPANRVEYSAASTDAVANGQLYPNTEYLGLDVRSKVQSKNRDSAGRVFIAAVPWGSSAVGASLIQNVGPVGSALGNAGLPVGSSYIFQGDRHDPKGQGWYTGPYVLVEALSSTFPTNWDPTANSSSYDQPPSVTTRVSFLDRMGSHMNGVGCDAGGCETSIRSQLMSAPVVSAASLPTSRSTQVSNRTHLLLKLEVTQNTRLSVDTCVSGTDPQLATAVGIYGSHYLPFEVAGYGAAVATGALNFAEGAVVNNSAWANTISGLTYSPPGGRCSSPHAQLTAVLEPALSPYYLVVKNMDKTDASSRSLQVQLNSLGALPATQCPALKLFLGTFEPTDFTLNSKRVWRQASGYLLVYCPTLSAWYVFKGSAKCGSGFYYKSTNDAATAQDIAGITCVCPAGLTNDGNNNCNVSAVCSDSTSCDCPPGSSGASCAACPTNTYKSTSGSAACTACNPGSTSPAGSTWSGACVCGAGEQPVGKACSACPVGSYKLTSGNQLCRQCPVGTSTSGTGATSAQDCATGPSTPQPALCAAIVHSGHQYNLTGETNGRPYYRRTDRNWFIFYSPGWGKYIRGGSITTSGASAVFSKSDFPQEDPAISCLCHVNGSTSLGGAGACSCRGNQVPVNGKCGYCPAASAFDAASGTCSTCSPSDCTAACGRASSGGKCICAAGFTGDFQDGNGTCSRCPFGTAKSAAGAGSCLPCGGGAVAEAGSSSCGCAPGYNTAPDGSCVDINECAVGGVGAAQCVNAGQVCVNSPGSWSCSCPLGQGVQGGDRAACTPCSASSFSNSTSSTCLGCPFNTVVPTATALSTGGTSQAACQCLPGLVKDKGGSCVLPQALVLEGSALSPSLNGCYRKSGTSNGQIRYAKSDGSSQYIAYVSRNSGEWVVLPNPATPERRYSVALHSRYYVSPVGPQEWLTYSRVQGRFVADPLRVTSAVDCPVGPMGPAPAPGMAPAPAPAPLVGPKPTPVKVALTLSGVTAAVANTPAVKTAITATIASSVGVTVDKVTITSITAARRLSAVVLRRLASSVVVAFEVAVEDATQASSVKSSFTKASTSSGGGSNSSSSGTFLAALSSSLSSSITVASGTTVTIGVTSAAATGGTVPPPTGPTDSKGEDKGLSGGVLALTVILVLTMVAGGGFFVFKRLQGAQQVEGKDTAEEHQEKL